MFVFYPVTDKVAILIPMKLYLNDQVITAQLYRDNFTEWAQQINPIYMDEQIPLLITLTVYFLPIPESVTLIVMRMRQDGSCDQPYLSEAATLM